MNSLLFTFALSLAATWALSRVALRLGLLDRVFEGESERKPARSAVPVIGGVAIVFSLLTARVLFGEAASSSSPALTGAEFSEGWTWGAILCAFFVGLGDDRFGFRPRVKLLGQATAGLCLALPILLEAEGAGFGGAFIEAVAWFLGAIIAQNAINTFDNADGAVVVVTGVGLLACGSPLAPVVLVFAVPNLLGRTGPGRADPIAYLGDAGSQLLGMALLLTPEAWPVLVLPLLDLARVSIQRLRRGLAPWHGDRRHLAHRLQRRGLGPRTVALVLLAIASPAFLAPNLVGVALSSLFFGLVVYRTRGLAEPDSTLRT